jgi:hypothetical protein
MKNKLLLCLTIFCGIAGAQNVRYSYDSKMIQGLLSSTLYVIPTGDKVFDDSLLVATKKYWAFTDVESLTQQEIKNAFKDKTKYFIVPMGMKTQNYIIQSPLNSYISSDYANTMSDRLEEKNKTDYICTAIYVCRGGFNLNPDFDQNLIICAAFPFIHRETVFWGLKYVMQNIVDDINILTKNKVSINMATRNAFHDPQEEMKDLFSQDPQILKGRTLLVPQLNVKVGLPENVLATYKYQYKIMADTDIAKLINSPHAKDYCFVIEGYGGDMSIADPLSKHIIYVSHHEAWESLKDRDIDALNEAIEPTTTKKKK